MSYIIKGEKYDWELVVGLEIHAQVISNSKLFSGSDTTFGSDPNNQVSLIDAAMPGMLPVINEHCIEQAVKTGLGLNAKINLHSVFERKNYFYADLPQGYQISQFLHPIVGEGKLTIEMEDGSTREIGIERLHMEQDAGKLIHDKDPRRTFIDLNRAGVCLMEIVSHPAMHSPEEAGAYVRKVRSIVRYLETCDGNMEEGSMRADVNVSVRPVGDIKLWTRTETKNVNSVRFMMQAIEFEAQRQVEVWEVGSEVKQETRLFDPDSGETRAMRSTEEAHDYRYFPCPDLLPIALTQRYVDDIKKTMPELPDGKKFRLMRDKGLSAYDADVLVTEREVADYFEVVAKGRDAKVAANWIISNLFGALKVAEKGISQSPINARDLGKLLDLIADGTISGRIAKDVFSIMFATGQDPARIVEEKGLKQITDTGAIEVAVDQVISESPEQADEVSQGNGKAIGWFVGQVMQKTQGKANPQVVKKMLHDKLGG